MVSLDIHATQATQSKTKTTREGKIHTYKICMLKEETVKLLRILSLLERRYGWVMYLDG